MRTTKAQRIIAFLLAVVFLFCGTFAVSAKNDDDEENALSSIIEQLNAISYNEYQNLEEYREAADATSPITIPGVDGVYTNAAGAVIGSGEVTKIDKDNRELYENERAAWDAVVKDRTLPYKVEVEGKTGLFIPDSGTVEWAISGITAPTKYSIEIEYYPVANKSASVERIFMINDEVPFAEARYLNISKVWATPYPLAMLEVGKNDPDTLLAEAIAAGFADAVKVTDEDATYIQFKKPAVWSATTTAFVDTYSVRFFNADIDKNEIRESLLQTPEWQVYTLKDSNGFTQDPFVFVVTPDEETGNVTFSFEGVNEPVVISNITLTPAKSYQSYEEYLNGYSGANVGNGQIKIESEYFSAVSDQTVYPMADTTSAANSPVATDRTLLNVIGGEKWQGVGQWVEYDFTVTSSGMYKIMTRHKQNILDGMSVCRTLYLYSDSSVGPGDAGYYNGIPFDEAARLKFGYSDNWTVGALSDGNTEFQFYFKEGVNYTLRLEVSLGSMGDIVRRVQESLDSINADYLNILKLTGTSPDEFRDYNFYNTIPATMGDMYDQHEEIEAIADLIAADATSKSSMTATLVNVSDLLEEMASDEDEVAKNLEQLKTYIGSLGTWLGDAKTQPLLLDYLVIQSPDAEAPKAEANFFEALWHELSGFIQSFFRNYDRMGATTEEATEENVEVWLAYGRDQSQVIRNLINNKFSKEKGITVNLKLVAGGTLLPSILANKGPDVYLGLGSGDVINYAIRGALESIETMEGYEELCESGLYFNEEAMMVLKIEDAEGVEHCYGVPETQSFAMMFVREDILAELNIPVPETWDDIRAAIPVLQANNMEIAMSTDANIFIYQMGGELFADNGMRINLDSNLALTAFDDMCKMFTMYSFPYQYNFANRFRTGEMPIGFADYTGTYNHLKVFATEIEGLWSFYPLPGIEDEDGNINHDAVAGVSAVVMITGCDQKENAWEFMKWYVGDECQTDYSNEMVAILGPSAKHATANKIALESLPWTREEYSLIKEQFDNLAGIPNYPGAYIVGRYTNFAFLDAYNDNQNPVESLLGYIDYINDEITRKRDEFGLETLDTTKKQTTLAIKRMQQAEEQFNMAEDRIQYLASCDDAYSIISYDSEKNTVSIDYETKDHAALDALASQLEAYNADMFGDAVSYLKQAASCLRSYEAYK